MAAWLAAPRGSLAFVVLSCCILAGVQGNLLRLFTANPPAFVNVSDLKFSIQTLLANVSNRLRCEEHGLQHAECAKCLDADSIIILLKLDPSSKSFSRQNAEDLAIFLAHQILYFESMCISLAKGCSSIGECQDEVLDIMGKYSTPSESLVKVLRIFKLYLKEDGDKECFSAQDILGELAPNNIQRSALKDTRQAFAIIMGRVFQGHCIGIGESVTDFLDDIFHHYGDNCSPYMSLGGLKRLIHDLQSGQGSDHDHDHHHSHHHDNSHDDSHDCDHKHAHFAHYHNHDHPEYGHYHGPSSFHGHNDSRGNHDHGHDHSSHEHYHDHPNHDHYHSNHDHDHSDHDHSNHDYSGDNFHPNHNHTYNEPEYPQLSTTEYPTIGNDLKQTDVVFPQNSSVRSSVEYSSIDYPKPSDNFSRLSIDEIAGEDKPTTYSRLSDHKFSTSTTSTNNVETSVSPLSTSIVESSASSPSTRIDKSSTSHPSTESSYMSENISAINEEPSDGEVRTRRSTSEQKEFNAPSASLRSDLSHPEEKEHIEEPPSSDDVKKVYLLQNEDHSRNMNLELSGTPHRFASLAAKCLSADELIKKFGLQENSTLTKSDFLDLCPALIQQVVSGVCTDSALPPPPLPSRMEVYGYGSLSVFIITLTSLAGVLLLPIMTKSAYNYIIAGFYGLAFSTLAADAMLHLMPQFLGLHSHGGDAASHGHSHEGGFLEPYVQMMLGVFFTIYALFLFEAIMGAISSSDQPPSQENKGHGHSHVHFPDELPTLISVKTKSEIQLNVSRDQSSSSLDTEVVEVESMKKPPNLMVSKPIFLGLTSMAIVVTLGDSMHNFGDGLAIGAAFSTGVRGGLSTAIAVFCHELPHEFGDFVVLLSTGLSFSKALWINFLSGLTCFAGLYIGIVIGDNEVARKWVMAVTAGIFLYVALGEMLPELREHRQGSRLMLLLIKNLGILAGLGIMLLISVYEDQIA